MGNVMSCCRLSTRDYKNIDRLPEISDNKKYIAKAGVSYNSEIKIKLTSQYFNL